jgi:hypothetical protein
MLDAGHLQPIVGAVVPFAQAATAYALEPMLPRVMHRCQGKG